MKLMDLMTMPFEPFHWGSGDNTGDVASVELFKNGINEWYFREQTVHRRAGINHKGDD